MPWGGVGVVDAGVLHMAWCGRLGGAAGLAAGDCCMQRVSWGPALLGHQLNLDAPQRDKHSVLHADDAEEASGTGAFQSSDFTNAWSRTAVLAD
jgi:hypothetical protein